MVKEELPTGLTRGNRLTIKRNRMPSILCTKENHILDQLYEILGLQANKIIQLLIQTNLYKLI